jgi:hypothetical protein
VTLRSVHVGVGGRGESHLRNSLEHATWKPVALVDVSEPALRSVEAGATVQVTRSDA